MEAKNGSRGKRLVFFPIPFVGSLNPMLELANIFHSEGFSISLINFNSTLDPNNHPHFTFHPIHDDSGFLINGSEISKQGPLSFFTKLNAISEKPLEKCLFEMTSDPNSEPVSCLITDIYLYSSQDVADRLKISRCVLRTGNVSSIGAFASYPVFKEKGYLSEQDHICPPENIVEDFPPLRIKDLQRLKYKTDPDIPVRFFSKVMNGAKASKGLIINSLEGLEADMLMTPIFRQVFPTTPAFLGGPFYKWGAPSSPSCSLPADNSISSWLNKQSPKSVLYVSFGSIAALNEAQFLELAWGLVNSNQPFLWVLRSGLVSWTKESIVSLLPDGLMEKVPSERLCIVDWAPQREVLSHPAVGGFLTHCGWNSTLESICEGVPMICLPRFGDQLINARVVSDNWKVGLQIEEDMFNRAEVENVIRRLMVEEEEECQEIRKRIECLKNMASAALKVGGSSHNAWKKLIDLILSF